MRQQGTVRDFGGTFGWIVWIDAGGYPHNIFVHWTAIQMDGYKLLVAGDVVEFEVEEDSRGKHAVRVQVIQPVA